MAKSHSAKAKGIFLAATLLEGLSVLLSSTAAPTTPLKTVIAIGTSGATAPINSAIRYTPLAGGSTINAMWQSVSSRPDVPLTVACTASNLVVRLPVALTGTQTWTWTLVKNGVDTALTVTIDNTGLVKADNTHTVAFADGDTCCLKSSPANTPAAQTIVQFGLLLTATGTTQTQPLMATFSSGATTDIAYGTFGTINSGTQQESSRRGYMPTSGTITKLRIGNNNAPGVGQTRSVTLMKNGVDVLTATITDANLTAVATGSVSFVAGDLIQLRRYSSATAAASLTFVGADFNPATAGESIFFSAGTGSLDTTTTLYQNLTGTSENTETTETNTYGIVPVPCTVTKLRANLGTAPGTGKSRTVTVRKNAADTAALVTVQDAATNGSWTGAVTLAAQDLVNWKEVPTNTPAASNPVCLSGVIAA